MQYWSPMHWRSWQLRSTWFLVFVLATCGRVLCDDGAASIGAGGLITRREKRVVMAKEILKISPSRVQVDYDFRNDTDHDVTTEVAFPIPPYKDGPEEWPAKQASFSDFALTVNNKPVKFQKEARAFLDGREVTAILNRQKIDIPTFGHFDWQKDVAPEFSRLPKSDQDKLIKLGLFDPGEPWGNWTVRLQYHWTQTFPSHSTVHIHHEYTPVRGFAMLPLGAIHKALHQRSPTDPSLKGSKWDMELLNSFCPSAPFLRSLEKSMTSTRRDDDYTHPQWVDFVLTSANTWKQPIEDFTLVVELDALYPKDPDKTLAAFCSPRHKYVERLSHQQIRVHVTDFVPKSELRIGFFDVPREEHVARKATAR